MYFQPSNYHKWAPLRKRGQGSKEKCNGTVHFLFKTKEQDTNTSLDMTRGNIVGKQVEWYVSIHQSSWWQGKSWWFLSESLLKLSLREDRKDGKVIIGCINDVKQKTVFWRKKNELLSCGHRGPMSFRGRELIFHEAKNK